MNKATLTNFKENMHSSHSFHESSRFRDLSHHSKFYHYPPLKIFQRINPNDNKSGLQEFVCLTHNCIITKERIRKLFYKETFSNEFNPDKINNFLKLANPLNPEEISELINCVPETSDIVVTADFLIPILENCSVDFDNPLWSKMVDYIYSQRLLVIKRLAETIDLDDASKIVYFLDKYLDIIPIKNCTDVFMLLEEAPLPIGLTQPP